MQVIVNRSRVRQRGLELNLPVKLTSLEKLPTITSEVRSMLHSHPKVSMEDEKPRCHVSQVGATSFNVAIACNLKPMVRLPLIFTHVRFLWKFVTVSNVAYIGLAKLLCTTG